MSQYTVSPGDAVLSLSGYGALVRESCFELVLRFSHRSPTGG
jgi:hypothetical protein